MTENPAAPNYRAITNDYHRINLISLRRWRHAAEIEPRDQGGPYMVRQAGYDPEDLLMEADEYVMGRSGVWTSVAMFLRMPRETRRAEYVFGTAAEVMALLENLADTARILRTGREFAGEAPETQEDDLVEAYRRGET